MQIQEIWHDSFNIDKEIFLTQDGKEALAYLLPHLI
jgi:hypothetical protein